MVVVKNGFTLVELLAVIIILGVISLIVVVSVWPTVKNSKNKLSDIQKNNIEEAAKTYYLQEGMTDEDYESESFQKCVNLSYLISNNYIEDSSVYDPKDSAEMTGSVLITYSNKKYTYKYQDNNCS